MAKTCTEGYLCDNVLKIAAQDEPRHPKGLTYTLLCDLKTGEMTHGPLFYRMKQHATPYFVEFCPVCGADQRARLKAQGWEVADR